MTFRGNALNPSCDAPGCHARAENPGPNGKDYCGKHKYVVTDEMRIAVLRELWLFMRNGHFAHMDMAAQSYEREIRDRMNAPALGGKVEGEA